MILIRIWCNKKEQFSHLTFDSMEDLEEYAVQELGHENYNILTQTRETRK